MQAHKQSRWCQQQLSPKFWSPAPSMSSSTQWDLCGIGTRISYNHTTGTSTAKPTEKRLHSRLGRRERACMYLDTGQCGKRNLRGKRDTRGTGHNSHIACIDLPKNFPPQELSTPLGCGKFLIYRTAPDDQSDFQRRGQVLTELYIRALWTLPSAGGRWRCCGLGRHNDTVVYISGKITSCVFAESIPEFSRENRDPISPVTGFELYTCSFSPSPHRVHSRNSATLRHYKNQKLGQVKVSSSSSVAECIVQSILYSVPANQHCQ